MRVSGPNVLQAVGEDADDAQRQTVLGNIADGLQTLGEYAGELGLSILIETHGDFCDSRVMQPLMDLVECRAVGVLWDTHHPWRFYEEDVRETFARIGNRVRHTHWKDSIPTEGEPIDADADARKRLSRR